ncbi:MAG: conserved phage C-terminal domain-containing protein [Candidatus Cloacimonadales bacterium]|nr:conserved phage C-terminal domain-containing protein [Methanolobus sp.]
MTNRELYIKAVELVGKEVMEVKQRQFLQRLLKKSTSGVKVKRPANETYQEIVTYLNTVTGKQYRWDTPDTKAVIRARLNEGFTPDEFKRVIDIKSKQWLVNEQFKYLRPSTLFGSKFEGYLQEWIIFKKKEEQDKAQYQRAVRREKGIPDEQEDPEEARKQKEWQELSKKMLALATDSDYKAFFKELSPMFQPMAYKKGLQDNLIKNLYVQWLREKKNN